MPESLDRTELEHFERELRRKQADLEIDIERLADGARQVAEASEASSSDTNVAEREGDVDLHLAREHDELLREVLAALERLREGTFGRCERCGRWIQRERLELLPYARRCAECAHAEPDVRAAPGAPML